MPTARRYKSPLTGLFGLFGSRTSLLVLGALSLAFIVFAGIDATKIRPHDGTVWLLGRPELEILDTPERKDGLTTPLRPGDKIVGIAHRMVSSPQAAAEQLKKQRPGTTVNYLIQRDGNQFEVAVPLAPTRVVDRTYWINVILTLVYLVIGFLVYWRSNNERPARLFFLLCLLFGMYFMTNLEQASYFWGDIISQNVGALARFMLPAIFLHFFLVFPEQKHVLTRHPFLAPMLYVLPMMFYFRFTLDQFFGSQGASISTTSWLVLGLYYVLGLAALLHGYLSYRDPLLRDRVRILTFGTLAAVLPFLIFKIGLEELTAQSELAQLGIVPLLAIPVSFGYCVARYQVMQIDVLLKRSLMYSLLSGGLVVIYLGVIVWIGGQALQLTGSTNPLVSVGATLAIAALLWPARSRLKATLDRRFYRPRTQMAEVLEEFSKEIPRLINRDTLLQRVGGRLCDLLGLPRLGFYTPADGTTEQTWILAGHVERDGSVSRNDAPGIVGNGLGADGAPATDVHRIAVGGNATNTDSADTAAGCPARIDLTSVVKTIKRRNEPFWIDISSESQDRPRQAITREQAELAAGLAEQRQLAEAGIELLVPMATGGRLVGLMALPFKRDREEYQLYEIQLLTIVAAQVALQIDNSRLLVEELAKQKLEEEMDMAREIQARLLPASLPTLAGVDIHAVNISSKQVSGDYYDMIDRDDGSLALVIADVSGKGMPASLLASNLQAALRAQCDTDRSPSAILSRINKQMHSTTDPQHFATLFLCFYNPQDRRLVYSSGGHNAPVILRADGRIELLEEGGLPLGAFDFGDYAEGTTVLEEGDLLFLYTDGLTETKDPDQTDEYGEERLNNFLQQNQGLAVKSLIEKVNEELNAFSGRQDADDDITLIGMKIIANESEVVAQAGNF